MRRAALIGLLGVSGCVRQAMLVSDVRIDGYDLVIERCPLAASSMTGCSTERQPLPVVRSTARTVPPARSAGRGAISRNLVRVSDALVPCAMQHSLQGVLQVTLEIDGSGHVTSANAEGAPPAFAECAAASLTSIPIATSSPRVTFAWQVPATAPALETP